MDILFAATQPGQGGGGILAFLPFILIMAILYFFMIRPQTKKQKEKEKMLSELKRGTKSFPAVVSLEQFQDLRIVVGPLY